MCACKKMIIRSKLLPIIEASVDNCSPAAGLGDTLDLGEVAGLDHNLQVTVVLVDVDREEELVLLRLGHKTLVLFRRASRLAQAAALTVGVTDDKLDKSWCSTIKHIYVHLHNLRHLLLLAV